MYVTLFDKPFFILLIRYCIYYFVEYWSVRREILGVHFIMTVLTDY
jgi:hypothetical protein